ncbi:uncharacterized protein JN550_011326 [Neoarthrinium moseri]|uniref:uncharacterized protein n=1 Tax=Neoarthrinium moseri TaxID=1658444 RepID=UPI001FDC5699|nr:uncharacterized protein JN550_011326 [Neoarthrinium moseri]KAI1860725.1 hypothetical protein JN550_011326 [Neoarthrinium moseri]
MLLFIVGLFTNNSARGVTVETVFQLGETGTVFENLALRESGEILATRADVPEIWSIDPSTKTGHKILTIPGAFAVMGIVQVSIDVFYVNSGKYSVQSHDSGEGSWEIWKIDLAASQPRASKLVSVPEAGLLNGMAKWDDNTILTVDSIGGRIYKVDLRTAKYEVAFSEDVPMKPLDRGLGINGIKVHDMFVYFTNTDRRLFYRTPVDTNLKPKGPAQLALSGFRLDDFTIDHDGTIYIATGKSNQILQYKLPGWVRRVAGWFDSVDLAGVTACEFGKSEHDEKLLYFSTSGTTFDQIEGAEPEPAKIAVIKFQEAEL